jgi:hypothetical protein
MGANKRIDRENKLSSFSKFLVTGELGPLNLNLTLDDVRDLLGKPKNTYRPFEGTKDDHLINLFYENLVITFSDDELAIYIIQFRNSFKTTKGGLPNQLEVDWFHLAKKMTFDDFIRFVKEQNIRCQKMVTEDEADKLIRFQGSPVEVNFNLDICDCIYQINCSNYGSRNWVFEEIV